MEDRAVRVGVQVLVSNENGLLLFGLRARGFGAGTWGLPGGHLEVGETLLECAARELLEETGLIGLDGSVIGLTDPDPRTNYHMQIAVRFAKVRGTPRIQDRSEVTELRFIDPSDIANDQFFLGSAGVIDLWRSAELHIPSPPRSSAK